MLATAATMAGFLSNITTPLPPSADFGVFLGTLDEDDRDAMATLDALEDAGVEDAEPSDDGEVARTRLAVAAERAPVEHDAVRDGAGMLLIVGPPPSRAAPRTSPRRCWSAATGSRRPAAPSPW